MSIEDAAQKYASSVAVSRRVHADIYIGDQCFSDVTSAVRAAYLAGASAGLLVQHSDAIERAAAEVVVELRSAMAKFGPFKNGHEGYAVILEEVDELWNEVKNNKGDDHVTRQRHEAIQIAAMALRFVVELGGRESTR